MADNKQSIKCVILTLRKENVLLPNALVAEIVSVKEVEQSENAPPWLLGKMHWRGAEVPLLSFEAAGGEKISRVNLNTQAVVLYGVGKNNQISENPYLALVMSGVPHVSHFSREQIKADTEADNEHPMVAQKVRINGASVSILDVDAMVDMVSEAAA
ncbi:MAG TPA: chemotaxis protein CheW [Gammaproteobacteria bacterium]|nr:chemotaxis protein CheW [Gammaproteobacteria bacterium]